MKRVLLVYTELLDYRIPIFKELGTRYDLTVTHAGKKKTNNDQGFKEIIIPTYSIWRFRYQSQILNIIRSKKFYAIIFFCDLAWLSTLISFIISPPESKRITWGFWLTKNPIANHLRLLIAKKADCNIFYNDNFAKDFRNLGLASKKMQIARNTVFVDHPQRDKYSSRDAILVIGSFKERKRNDIVVNAFDNICQSINKPIQLMFIGEGEEKSHILEIAQKKTHYDRIKFYPYETNFNVIRKYYSRAVCSVSFGQAGLSILQSFGHGVPFVTMRNAISGGEIENIKHNFNGFLCEPSQESLEYYLLKIFSNKEYARKLGENALKYYIDYASTQVMVSGFCKAIEVN